MKNTKKATATKTAVKTAKTENKTVTKVHLVKTNYHYFRHWVKSILREGGITTASFVKNADSYDGVIKVASSEVVKAKNVLDTYKKKNPETVDMWS